MIHDNKDNTLEISDLAKKINELSGFEIVTPDSGDDFDVYSLYLNKVDGWRQKVIDWALTKLPFSVTTNDGEVFFTRSAIRNALAHGKGKLKLLSIPYIPMMLQKGILFHTKKENGFVFFNYTHPFIFEGENHFAIIVVREDLNGKRFYDNEFITKIKTADGLDYSQGLPSPNKLAETKQKTCAHPSTGNILRNILNVK
jgi:hypothetical protein